MFYSAVLISNNCPHIRSNFQQISTTSTQRPSVGCQGGVFLIFTTGPSRSWGVRHARAFTPWIVAIIIVFWLMPSYLWCAGQVWWWRGWGVRWEDLGRGLDTDFRQSQLDTLPRAIVLDSRPWPLLPRLVPSSPVLSYLYYLLIVLVLIIHCTCVCSAVEENIDSIRPHCLLPALAVRICILFIKVRMIAYSS